ncbi:hypothetical protein L1887_06150 [Cichorium endivia]|nr:hypothetical protein L1887_06150 [Cichorium endivia]
MATFEGLCICLFLYHFGDPCPSEDGLCTVSWTKLITRDVKSPPTSPMPWYCGSQLTNIVLKGDATLYQGENNLLNNYNYGFGMFNVKHDILKTTYANERVSSLPTIGLQGVVCFIPFPSLLHLSSSFFYLPPYTVTLKVCYFFTLSFTPHDTFMYPPPETLRGTTTHSTAAYSYSSAHPLLCKKRNPNLSHNSSQFKLQ